MPHLLVTYMQMLSPPKGPTRACLDTTFKLEHAHLSGQNYLPLYRAIGGPVGWDSRLLMPEAELAAFLTAPTTHIYLLQANGHAFPAGMCEFDAATWPEVELTHFGLLPTAQGRGLGSYLLDAALRAIWQMGPSRVWLHTDTMDHPNAKLVYERAGFSITHESWEDSPD